VAIAGDDFEGTSTQALVEAFQSGGFAHALTPISAVSDVQAFAPDEATLAGLASQYGANQVLVVEGSSSGFGLTANITDISLNTGQSRLATVTGAQLESLLCDASL